jgi:hypothetical protein
MENVWKKLINLVITTEVFHVDGKKCWHCGETHEDFRGFLDFSLKFWMLWDALGCFEII